MLRLADAIVHHVESNHFEVGVLVDVLQTFSFSHKKSLSSNVWAIQSTVATRVSMSENACLKESGIIYMQDELQP